MMRSLFSGVSGLRTHQLRMDVIGNNIANVNTVGFKAARMTFADAMSQRVSGATSDSPETGRAGRNPMQVGLGVNVGGIDTIMNQGAAQRTDRGLDLAIQNNGFFIVEDDSGTFFTRAGNLDWNGNRFSINGMQLMGWPAVEDSSRPGNFIIERGPVQPLETPEDSRFMEPQATTLINAIGNLNVNDLVDGRIVRQMDFFDSIGNRYTVDMFFEWHPPEGHANATENGPFSDNTRSLWSYSFLPGNVVDGYVQVMAYLDGDRSQGTPIRIRKGQQDDNMVNGNAGEPGTGGMIGFNPRNGQVSTFFGGSETGDLHRSELTLFVSVPALAPPSVVGGNPEVGTPPPNFNDGTIRLNMAGLRQHAGAVTSLQALMQDGNRPGELQDISVGADGIITGRYSNGEMRPLGQIPVAAFLNAEGLERVGNNLWVTSANSGGFDGVGTDADLIAGALEMSNVDMSGEFTEMITTQRGFQANSRIITTSDEMIQELVNLKR